MILTDRQIKIWAENGNIVPYFRQHVNPASIDICVGDSWIDVEYPADGSQIPGTLYKPNWMYGAFYNAFRKIFPVIGAAIIHRPSAVLAVTLEWIRIPDDMAASVKLKTTPTRKGLGHPVADWIDPGFQGRLTLMLNAIHDINLKKGQRIAQLVLYKLSESVEISYQSTGHYNFRDGPMVAWDEEHKYGLTKDNAS